MNPATIALELSDSRPALMVVAFGTNEGFDAALDLRIDGKALLSVLLRWPVLRGGRRS
jgi:hypothetical protein